MQILAASHLLTMTGEPLAGGAVAFADGVITAIGPLDELRRTISAPVRDFPGCVLMPGLVNAHTHLELTHFPAWIHRKDIQYSPRTYVDWIIQVIKVKRGLQLEELAASLREGLDISLQAGTTMVGDILSDRRLLPFYTGKSGSGRIYFELIGHHPPVFASNLDNALADLDSIPESFLAGLAPHAPFTVSGSFLTVILEAGRVRNLPCAMHVAESREETAFLHDSSGRIAADLYPFVQWREFIPPPMRTTPVAWLDSMGALTPDFLAVHGVHISPDDAAKVKKSGATLVLCPRSNEKLDVGRAPVQLFKSLNIPLALGTDSLASNDTLSLWDEMRFLHQSFPGQFTPLELLAMATINGARAIGRGRETGTLEVGKRADFQLLEPHGGSFGVDLPAQILYNSRVAGVWSAGRAAVPVD